MSISQVFLIISARFVQAAALSIARLSALAGNSLTNGPVSDADISPWREP